MSIPWNKPIQRLLEFHPGLKDNFPSCDNDKKNMKNDNDNDNDILCK